MTAPTERVAAGHRVLRWGTKGSPLLLLHGFTGRAELFGPLCDAVHRRAPERLIAAVALPGHDPLTPLSAAADFAGVVDGLAEVVDALGFERPHVVGYSLGARLALGLLVRHPRAAGRATLIGVNPGLTDPMERAARARRDALWAAVLRRDGLAAFLRRWEAQPLLAGRRRLSPKRRAAQRRARLTHDPEQLARALETLGLAAMPSFWDALPALRQPIQLLVGERDAKFRAVAAEMLRRLPGARLQVVRGAGHDAPLERPAAVAQLL